MILRERARDGGKNIKTNIDTRWKDTLDDGRKTEKMEDESGRGEEEKEEEQRQQIREGKPERE